MPGIRVAEEDDAALGVSDGPGARPGLILLRGRRAVATAHDVGMQRTSALQAPHALRSEDWALDREQTEAGGERDDHADTGKCDEPPADDSAVEPDRVLDVAIGGPRGQERRSGGRGSRPPAARPQRPRVDDQRPVPEIETVREVADPDGGTCSERARSAKTPTDTRSEENTSAADGQEVVRLGAHGRDHDGCRAGETENARRAG